MISIEFHNFILLISGIIPLSFYLVVRKLTDSRSTTPRPEGLLQPSSDKRAVRLCQVYPSPEDETATATDIDIIAIHGLDTNSQRTWTWEREGRAGVNWLADSNMLPQRTPRARIFTCDWPADLFEPSDLVPKRIDEHARLLLASIKNRPLAVKKNRPIVFIASCLGGIILMKALVMAKEEYLIVGKSTRGIIFLATPFRGTSFQDVAKWAEPGLRALAFRQKKTITGLLEHAKPNFDLGEIVRGFASFCRENELNDNVFTFYETGLTSLPRKIFPWLRDEGKPLVDQVSATLDFVPHPIALDRPHVQMNKFDSPDDRDYGLVAGQIETLLRRIYEGSPLETASGHMRNVCYSKDHLKIERLSGDQLPMDRCYINLTIVEREIDPSRKESTVTLPSLFQTRHENHSSGRPMRRIMIHGRAGTGKTTLCKKIVYDFTYSNLWSDLFDWVLWVPLRNLKLEERRRSAEYSFRDLFRHEYFTHHPKRDKLTDALWDVLHETKGARILFILDGLDEVSHDLEGNMLRFLRELLNQPNIIVTARPHAKLPINAKPIDLELDTTGFLPAQIDAYVEHAFTNLETGMVDLVQVKGISSFLNDRPLIQDLVRIPIQLDVLCYTWEDNRSIKFSRPETQETMTSIYQRIERALWRKDAEKLGIVAPSDIQDTHDEEIAIVVDDEKKDLEFLAFCGMYNDVIDFEPEHCGTISRNSHHLSKELTPLQKLLRQVSFLRSSDSPLAGKRRSYHFLHLTFQEYFGARYFVRQWRAEQTLRCLSFREKNITETHPAEFLCKNKYSARYNVFWRFVSGLLTLEKESRDFFQIIDNEPRDLIGYSHQELVVRCLSEIPINASHRSSLEDQLVSWVLYECERQYTSRLANERDFPVAVLEKALQQKPRVKEKLLSVFGLRSVISEQRAQFMVQYIQDQNSRAQHEALDALTEHPVAEKYLREIIACLDSRSHNVRTTAFYALEGRNLPKELLRDIVPRFESIYARMTPAHRNCAVGTLYRLLAAQESVQTITEYMQHDNKLIREIAKRALPGRLLSMEDFRATMACLEDQDSGIRSCAEDTLSHQLAMKASFENITTYLQHEKWQVKEVALNALDGRPLSSKYLPIVMALSLSDEPREVKKAAERTFKNQRITTQEAIQGVLAYLKHEKAEARDLALRTLESLPLLREHVQAVTLCLEDKDAMVRMAALNTLHCQPLLEDFLPAIVSCFQDVDPSVRKRAIGVFEGRSVTGENLRAILRRFEDDDNLVVRQVGVTLRSSPTKEYIQDVLPFLQSPRGPVRRSALTALAQATLSQDTLQAVLSIVRRNKHSVSDTLEVLKSQPNLPDDILEAVAATLHRYTDIDDRKLALETIEAQSSVPTSLLNSVRDSLHLLDRKVTWIATRILCRQGDLSCIPLEYVRILYERLLRAEEPATWQDIDNMSHITIGNSCYVSAWPDGFRDAIENVRKDLGIPSPSPCIV